MAGGRTGLHTADSGYRQLGLEGSCSLLYPRELDQKHWLLLFQIVFQGYLWSK